jgi:hypothetical protein
MNLSLTNIIITPHLSEETTCFQATVQVDGKPAFIASNRGQGADNEYRPYGSDPRYRTLLEQVQVWARTLPPTIYTVGSTTVTVNSDLDCVIDQMLMEAESELAHLSPISTDDMDPEALAETAAALHEAVNELLDASRLALNSGSLPNAIEGRLRQVVDKYDGAFRGSGHDGYL